MPATVSLRFNNLWEMLEHRVRASQQPQLSVGGEQMEFDTGAATVSGGYGQHLCRHFDSAHAGGGGEKRTHRQRNFRVAGAEVGDQGDG